MKYTSNVYTSIWNYNKVVYTADTNLVHNCDKCFACANWKVRILAIFAVVWFTIILIACTCMWTFDLCHVVYCIASNVCGNLIVHFAVETENAQFYTAQYYFHAICVGVIRRESNSTTNSVFFSLKEQVACSGNLLGNMSNNHVTFNHRYGVWIMWVVVFLAAL